MAFVGFLINIPFSKLGFKMIGWIIIGIFALVGFAIGTFKVPRIESISFTRHTAGENIDDVIKRAILFKLKRNKIYVYAKEEKDNDD